MDYIAYLHKEGKSDFGVSFPDFPGCVTAGKSLDEARRNAPEALAFHIAGMIEEGEKIPKPSKIDDLAADPARKNAVAFLVSADFKKSKTVRVNVTARQNQIKLIDRLAREAGMTRSAYMVQSATSEPANRKRGGSTRRPVNVYAKRAESRNAKRR
jgi:predicted RNase H-like HicB family nuclease